jgi:hypothetical protein
MRYSAVISIAMATATFCPLRSRFIPEQTSTSPSAETMVRRPKA